ncbi:MAG: replication initiator protein A [Lachnospiraceae bacterium]|nr:replication initiator protein A [Lachnospiraceae bacterium]
MSIKSNYIKFPREFTVEPFVSMSPYAKLMYVILSDRLEGSEKNEQFQDDDGTPFVYFGVNDLAVVLGCGTATVTRTLNELQNVGLIYRHRQYSCKGTKIYVYDVEKVMLKLVKNDEKCPIKTIALSNQFDWTVQSN